MFGIELEVSLVDENERTEKGMEEWEEEAFCELKDIDDKVELEGEVVCEEVKLGIENHSSVRNKWACYRLKDS